MQHYETVLCSSNLPLFDKKNRSTDIVKYYNLKERFCILKYFETSFISVIQSWIFSIIQSSVQDLSEINLICWFIINDGNTCAA